jgi:hypothetical protein
VVGLVQIVDQPLQFLDAPPAAGAGQLEAPRGRGRGPINRHEVPQRHKWREKENQHRPKPFLPPHGVNKHPELEHDDQPQQRVVAQQCQVIVQIESHPQSNFECDCLFRTPDIMAEIRPNVSLNYSASIFLIVFP